MAAQDHHVVIIGGGFGGLNAAQSLRKAPVRITLLDRRNFHLFQPLLYQVATGGLSPANIATPLRFVTNVEPNRVTVRERDRTEHISAYTILWTAGVRASPLGTALAKAAGAQVDRAGRVQVQPDLSLPGHPEIFVLGDLANFSHQTGKPLPGVAPVAMQQGRYVAQLIRARLRGQTLPAFHYKDKGNLATIGRAAAVADLHWLRLSGYLAWWIWLFIHLMYIVMFGNRVLILMQWAWNYFTFSRSARLITGESSPVLPHDAASSEKVSS